MKNNKILVIALSLVYAATAFVFYGRFLDNFFFYDDFKYLENIISGPSAVALGFGNLRVISNFIWLPIHAISGLNPFYYNLFSVVLHPVNAILLYLLLSKLLQNRELAIISSVIFLVGSVGCDAIFWKCANSGLLNVFFYLSSLYSYTVFRQKGSKRHFVLSIFFFLLAAFSKEEAASMPLMLILFEAIFFNGFKDKKGVIYRVMPYVAIILFYLAATKLVFNYILHTKASFENAFKFHPLYNLFGGWSAFSFNPEIKLNNLSICLIVIGTIFSCFWIRDKKLLLFGYVWIIITFLPQSLFGWDHLDSVEGIPADLISVTSISRYLYLTWIGSSIIMAAVICRLKDKLPGKIYYPVALAIMFAIASLNYKLVQKRGIQWREAANPTLFTLDAMKKTIPSFPPGARIKICGKPMHDAATLSAVHAFYGTNDIAYFYGKADENCYIILPIWKNDEEVYVKYLVGEEGQKVWKEMTKLIDKH